VNYVNKTRLRNLLDKLQVERDEIKLKLHLASMEAKEEFDELKSSGVS